MTSAYTCPILVSPEGSGVVLQRVPLSGPESTESYNEDWLQNLMYRHPDILPVGEIDNSYSGMVPVCREMTTTAGSIDVVYVTPDGRPVIVEAKLWRNPEARRKVLAQILDYARDLTRWDFEKFDAAVRQARHGEDGGAHKGLLELMGYGADTTEAARFHDSLTRSLRRGDLLLLIVGDGIREGVGAITDFLEGQGSLHFTFGLVEMAVFRMPDGSQLVQPRILTQSTIVRRIIVDLRNESLQAHEGSAEDTEQATEDGPSPEAVESQRRCQEFWTGYLQKLQLDDKSQAVSPAARAGNQFFTMPKNTQAWVSAFIAPSRHRAGVYLTFYKGPIGDRLYEALLSDKVGIERALDMPVQWESDGSKHAVVSRKSYPGLLIDEHAEAAQRTLADWTNRYINVFRPRLEKLVREST
jgi:hypothetical protein